MSVKNYQLGPMRNNVGNPAKVLMVAEKPSIAESITQALNGGKAEKKGKGVPIFNFRSNFKGQPAMITVTSVTGHVYSRDFPKEQQQRGLDPSKLFDSMTIRKLESRSRPIKMLLQKLSEGIDYVVLWLDCDKEGENICYEVLDICKRNIPKSSFQRVFRAKFSSIAPKDIQVAYNNLKEGPNYNESLSVDARQILDLKIGVAFSRF